MTNNAKRIGAYFLFVATFVLLTAHWVTPGKKPDGVRKQGRANDNEVRPVTMRVNIRAVEEVPPVKVSEPVPVPRSVPAKPDSARDAEVDLLHGGAPFVSADYRRNLGFPGYVQEMERLGGMFLIYDGIRDKIRGAIDMNSGTLTEVDTSQLSRMSPRIREINGEVAVADVVSKARRRFGNRNYSVILLLPQEIDRKILRAIAERLQATGTDVQSIVRLDGEYVRGKKGLCLRLTQAKKRDGEQMTVSIDIPL